MSIEEKQNFQTFQDSNDKEYPNNEKEVQSFIKKYYKSGLPVELIGSGSKKKLVNLYNVPKLFVYLI